MNSSLTFEQYVCYLLHIPKIRSLRSCFLQLVPKNKNRGSKISESDRRRSMLKLTLRIPWAESASDVDLQRNQVDGDAGPGVVVLRVVPRWGGDPELPVRTVAGTGDFELEVKKGGIKVWDRKISKTQNLETKV